MRFLPLPSSLLVVVALGWTGSAEAASYALMPVSGPKGSAPKVVERAILDRLETRGDEGHLGPPRPGERGLSVSIKKRGRVYVARLSLSPPGGGAPVAHRVATYHPRRGVSSAIAVLLDRLLDVAGSDPEPTEDPALPEDLEVPEGELPEAEEAAESYVEEATSASEEASEAEVEASDAAEPVSAEAETGAGASDPEALGLELGLGIGTQVLTRYTLSVDSAPTALAYRSGALFLLHPSLRFRRPGTPLWLSLQGDFASVGFTLATDPPLVPEVASGAFLGLGLSAGWAFSLGSRFSLSPALGLRIERLGVEEQAVLLPGEQEPPETQPFDVVLSSFAFVPTLGAVGRLELTTALTVSAEAHLRWVAAYAESPSSSGDAGGGVGLQLGLSGSWAVLSWLSFELVLRYQYSALSFQGVASRAPFANDPPLVDSSVQFEDLKLSLGPVLRF